MPFIALIIAATIAVSGTAVVADRTLPNQSLYDFKLAFNEPIRAFLAVTEDANADWHIEAASRRLSEAEKLSEQGRLSAQDAERLQSNFEQHAKAVASAVSRLESKNQYIAAANIADHFKLKLQAHANSLARLQSYGETEAETSGVLGSVGNSLSILHALRASIAARAETEMEGVLASDTPAVNTQLSAEARTALRVGLTLGGASTTVSGSAAMSADN